MGYHFDDDTNPMQRFMADRALMISEAAKRTANAIRSCDMFIETIKDSEAKLVAHAKGDLVRVDDLRELYSHLKAFCEGYKYASPILMDLVRSHERLANRVDELEAKAEDLRTELDEADYEMVRVLNIIGGHKAIDGTAADIASALLATGLADTGDLT